MSCRYLQVAWLGAQLEHAGEDHLGMLLVGGDEALGVGLVGGNWLLHHHMHAGANRQDAERRVLKMGRCDNDRVNFAPT